MFHRTVQSPKQSTYRTACWLLVWHTLRMETVYFRNIDLIFYATTRRHISEDNIFCSHCRQKLKFNLDLCCSVFAPWTASIGRGTSIALSTLCWVEHREPPQGYFTSRGLNWTQLASAVSNTPVALYFMPHKQSVRIILCLAFSVGSCHALAAASRKPTAQFTLSRRL
jgi:hypothetical protein